MVSLVLIGLLCLRLSLALRLFIEPKVHYRSRLFSSPPSSQFQGFVSQHAGTWAGVQTIFFHTDTEDNGDKLLCGTSLLPDNTLMSVNHTNFFVDGPVNFEDSSSSIQATSILKKHVTIYRSTDPLVSKVCSNVLLGGPGISKDGLSLQFSIRHDNSRLRVMIQYEASDFVFVPATSIKIPSVMTIADISISREILLPNVPVLETMTLDPPSSFIKKNPTSWQDVIMNKDGSFPCFAGSFKGTRYILDPSSKEIKEEIIPSKRLDVHDMYMANLEALNDFQTADEEKVEEVEQEMEEQQSREPFETGERIIVVNLKQNKQLNGIEGMITDLATSAAGEDKAYMVKLVNGFTGRFSGSNLEAADEEDPRFLKIYRGGLLIDAPLVITAGDVADIRVYWSQPVAEAGNRVYKAQTSFEAMTEAAKNSGRKKKGASLVQQPILLGFSVEDLWSI